MKNFTFRILTMAVAVGMAFGVYAEAVEIGSAADFASKLTADPAGEYKLTADIALSGWTPIEFSGTLDGDGHKITGLTGPLFTSLTGDVTGLTLDGTVSGANTQITPASGADFALLAVTNSNSKISDSKIVGYELLSTQSASKLYNALGFFVARSYDGCVFSGCTVDASCKLQVGKDMYGGGIAGYANRSDTSYSGTYLVVATNCVNGAAMTASQAPSSAGSGSCGGIFGYVGWSSTGSEVLIIKCCNNGDFNIESTTALGNLVFGGIVGIVGGDANASNYFRAIDCVNNGDFLRTSGQCNNNCFGGLVGFLGRYPSNIYINRCINNGDAKATGNASNNGACLGGFLGRIYDVRSNRSITILNSINRGNISTASTTSGKSINGSGAIGFASFNGNYAGISINIRNCSFEGTIDANVAGLILNSTTTAKEDAVFNVDNCWFVTNAPLCNISVCTLYAESNLQFYSSEGGGNDATACAALNTAAAAETTYQYSTWSINSDTTHPEPAAATESYTVRFLDYDGTTELSVQQVNTGYDATPPADPVRAGYTFAGWSGNYTAVTKDEDVVATYTAGEVTKYTVRFLDWDSTVLSSQQVEEGKGATAPSEPTRSGYVFTGWDKAYDNITADTDITAQYEEATVPTVFVSPDGEDAAGRGSKTLPYKTIRYAIDQLTEGIVYVLPGTYAEVATTAGKGTGAGCVSIEKAVSVIGFSGNPEDVIITHGTWPSGGSSPIVRLDHASAVLRDVTVYNGDYLEGGNIHVTANGGLIDHCISRKSNNTAWNSYGTSACLNGGRMTRTKVCENGATSSNGQVFANGTAQIDNCLFIDLTTGGSYAVRLDGNTKLVNCTISRNTGTSTAGVWCSSKTAKVVNCVICGNVAKTGTTGSVWSGANAACFVNCLTDLEITGSTGNIVDNPSFIDYDSGDFRLSIVSPGIDAGADVASYNIGDLDFAGKPRLTGTIDVGCFENNKTDVSCGFTFGIEGVSVVRDYNADCISHTLPAKLILHGGACGVSGSPTYKWTITDAHGTKYTKSVSTADCEWEVTASGLFDLKLEVGSVASSLNDCFLTSPAIMYVTGGNSAAAEPYDTPETGAASVADAANFAATGAKVIVQPTVDNEIVQNGEVTVLRGISFYGYTDNPADTILRNSNKLADSHRIFILNHPLAGAYNLTVKDGCCRANNSEGGDIRIDGYGGTVSNCVFMNGRAMHFSSQAAALRMSAGLVTHCVFTGEFSSMPAYNADPCDKGLVAYLTGASARLENSLFYDIVPITVVDSGTDGVKFGPTVSIIKGTMRNCTVVPNYTTEATTSTDANFKKWNSDGGCAIYCGSNGRVENCAAAGLINFVINAPKPFGGTLKNFHYCVGDGSQDISATDNCKLSTEESMFVDASAKNYHPRTRGALHNCAADVPEFASVVDLSGLSRLVQVLDIGCYESQYRPGLIITGRRPAE